MSTGGFITDIGREVGIIRWRRACTDDEAIGRAPGFPRAYISAIGASHRVSSDVHGPQTEW